MWLGLFNAEEDFQEETDDPVPHGFECPDCGENRHDYLDITGDITLIKSTAGWQKRLQPVACLSCGAIYHI